ncbi:recombinase family protein [Bacillus wiedmannii]|uniref:recombinase family protein n=1 Tax=Bacillus wiedmannii TaxID=1890302 RepID=UPI0007DB56EA|nr:recombinase family protein [Bacillus wiedmannii]OAK45027.1 resolvase [Bacillus wiedmannii]
MKTAVIYARVSTAEQAEEGYSIDAQIETVTRKCEQEGRQVLFKYIDRGVSGKAIKKRLSLQQLLKDAKEKKFDEVWVWKTNRLARNHLDLLKIVDELDKANVGFKSCSESFDTSTATGKLLLNVLASIGEFERETIIENVKMGMKQRAKQGKWNGGQVLGYKSINMDKNEGKTRLEVVEEEAFIVREIFQLYSEGKGLKSLTNHINKLGYRSKRGNLFSINAVKEILMNPIYIGKIRYNRKENWSEKRRAGINPNPIISNGEHKAIIPIELWERVQKLYAQRSHKPTRVYSGTFPLTGLLKCPACGSSMVAGRVKRRLKNGSFTIHRYYQCGAWRNKGTAACSSNGVKADLVEEFVFNKIRDSLFNEEILEDIVKNMNEKRKNVIKPLEDQLRQMNKYINELENKKNKIFELYEEGIIDKESLTSRLNIISEDIENNIKNKGLLQEKLKLNNSESIEYELVKKLMKNFNGIINNAEHERKKTILNLVIERINVNKDRQVDSIILHFDGKSRDYILGDKEDESLIGDSSSFNFSIIL